mgnify:CR=1 FL=1
MKVMIKVLGSIFALGLVMLVAFHLIMLYGLTKAMRDVVLPRIKTETGIDAKVGKLSINVANGMLYLSDVEVRNPEGFLLENLASIDRVEVAVDIKSLFKQQPLIVKNVEVENALVNVIRNQEGEFNFNALQEGLPKPAVPADAPPASEPGEPPPETPQETGAPAPAVEPEPLPEILFERVWAKATLRYVDFKLNQLDVALDLDLKAMGLSTRRAPETPWGAAALKGALGTDQNSFQTDINLRLAPVTNPDVLSFDLTGRIMEIDTRMIQSAYDRMGIRSSPFGIEPRFQCRANRFENSEMAIVIRDVVLEDKLADRLGGMGAIESLRFVAPIQGTLQYPTVDVQSALMQAIGGNTRTIFDAWMKGQIDKHGGVGGEAGSVTDAAVEALGEQVEEIGESETVKKVLKDLADGEPSATNQPAPISSDTIVDILGEQVEEIGENEELKDELKNLGKWLFGK